MSLDDLYPEIEPHATGKLALDPPHEMYWEQCGNPDGAPVVFLHGGPGAGTTPTNRRYFDPDHYRIILFDQRGAGRSTPLGALERNETGYLVADIEALRVTLETQADNFAGSMESRCFQSRTRTSWVTSSASSPRRR